MFSSGTGKVIEFKDLCANFTTDMIGSTAFGLKVNSLKDQNAPFRVYGRHIFDYNISRSIEFLTIFFFPGMSKYLHPKFFGKKSNDFLRTVFWDVINQRIQSGEKRNDLIDLLIELRDKHKDDTTLEGFSE